MSKRKNKAAVALGTLGGKARGKRHDISELNRRNAIAGHRRQGHTIKSEKCKVVTNPDTSCKALGSNNVDDNLALGSVKKPDTLTLCESGNPNKSCA